ncbi:MAG TPA: HigA family addiction module antitoxin [Anaerolineales bacterium]|jgi:addiction module HigA family antidote
MAEKKIKPLHPGKILLEEFLLPWGMSQNQLASLMGVNVSRVNEIVRGRRGLTGDTALRLARVTGMSPEFWLGIQNLYDIETAKDELGDRLEQEVTPAEKVLSK